ncbi:RNA polymerase beta subunit [Vibrio phage Aphrodite1]|uniref:DNA-directer RNA polymerase beta subunit n=1 Tax=Vibrio phage Aphrodite1 TaxID=2070057 RepID=A0A2I7QHR8_9CAUD|nr:RNA polymerase beta subunit [Vibrio phage Aphrodite1]AUR80932.1 DNA-directer RNA polymerase beta subunit [Vibrio phage Aphrodite1]
MKTISLREFANLSEKEVIGWRKDLIKVKVIDDEGKELVSNTYDLIMTWYGLELHRRYEHLKIPYTIKEIIHCKVYNDQTLQRPLQYMLDILISHVGDPVEADFIKQIVYIWHFKINNILVYLGSPGVISATAEDVMEVFNHPMIADIRERLRRGEITYDEAEEEFKQTVLREPTLDFSTFIMQARTGAVSINQGFQTFISRGACFDLNNRIMPNPIEPSFAEGITNLADVLAESRSAGKALVSNGKALEDSEWFHRKLHLTASPVKDIDHYHDCGTTTVVPVSLKSKDLINSLQGKYYHDENGNLRLITRDEVKKLKVGETIHLRSMQFCRNEKAPCAVCYGQMRMSVPYNVIMRKSANPGMLSGTAIAEPIGQGMLSTKHFMRHVQAVPFTVMTGDEEYITTNGDDIFLKPEMVKSGTRIQLPVSMISELTDLRSMENLDEVQDDQLTCFPTLTLTYEMEDPMLPGTKTNTTVHLDTQVSSRQARMSKEFIEYTMLHGWEKTKKYIEIDIKDFDTDYPLLCLPYVYEDLDKYRSEIESFLALSRRNKAWRDTQVTPEFFGQVMTDFWLLINRKFKNINMVHIETLLHSTTAVAPSEGLYRLPVGDEPRYFIPFKNAIENRGFGSLIIYQGQNKVIESPSTFSVKERQATAMECFFTNAAN